MGGMDVLGLIHDHERKSASEGTKHEGLFFEDTVSPVVAQSVRVGPNAADFPSCRLSARDRKMRVEVVGPKLKPAAPEGRRHVVRGHWKLLVRRPGPELKLLIAQERLCALDKERSSERVRSRSRWVRLSLVPRHEHDRVEIEPYANSPQVLRCGNEQRGPELMLDRWVASTGTPASAR